MLKAFSCLVFGLVLMLVGPQELASAAGWYRAPEGGAKKKILSAKILSLALIAGASSCTIMKADKHQFLDSRPPCRENTPTLPPLRAGSARSPLRWILRHEAFPKTESNLPGVTTETVAQLTSYLSAGKHEKKMAQRLTINASKQPGRMGRIGGRFIPGPPLIAYRATLASAPRDRGSEYTLFPRSPGDARKEKFVGDVVGALQQAEVLPEGCQAGNRDQTEANWKIRNAVLRKLGEGL